MISVKAGAASDVGRVRQINEDSVFAGPNVFAVADGMGGHAAGEVASALAVACMGKLGDRAELKPDDLRAQLALANQDILSAAAKQGARQGMGTTIAGLGLVHFAGAQHWAVFCIGDSRVYRFVLHTLVQMTIDHTEFGRRNIVTRALGMDPAPEPDLWVFPPTPGERFLICSDGLTRELADAQIADILAAQPEPQAAAEALVRQAIEAGGRDNVTVVVVDHLLDQSEVDSDTLPRLAVS